MWFRYLFDRRKGRSLPHRDARQRAATRRLALERLEDRAVPATLSVVDAALVEGHAGTQFAEAVVRLSEPATRTITVNYHTTDGTATAGSDFNTVSGKLSLAPGQTSKSILVPVRGDRLGELDETVLVKLNASKNAKIADGTGVVTIRDDEPRLSIGDVSLLEGDCRCGGGTAFTFTVSLSATSDEAVTVNYATADGMATAANEDYSAAWGLLTFSPGETTKTFTVWVYGDVTPEGDEYFNVILSGASANTIVSDEQGVGTIREDDGWTPPPPDPCTIYCCNPDGCGGENPSPDW